MDRRNIWDLTAAERTDLKVGILEYIALPGVVDWHRDNHELHTSGYFFLMGHRQYLEELETYLRGVGKLGPGQPLPRWDPADPNPAHRRIPREFIHPESGEGSIHDIWAPLRPVIAFSFFPFKGIWLRFWPPFPIPVAGFMPWRSLFGFVLCWTSHFAVHALVGGWFANIPRTSRTPLFWIWHAYIDDLYRGWEEAHMTMTHP